MTFLTNKQSQGRINLLIQKKDYLIWQNNVSKLIVSEVNVL